MTSGSEVMCRKKVNTPRSIYRVFTVPHKLSRPFIFLNINLIFKKMKGLILHLILLSVKYSKESSYKW